MHGYQSSNDTDVGYYIRNTADVFLDHKNPVTRPVRRYSWMLRRLFVVVGGRCLLRRVVCLQGPSSLFVSYARDRSSVPVTDGTGSSAICSCMECDDRACIVTTNWYRRRHQTRPPPRNHLHDAQKCI